jgi:hypothetical protein
MHTELKTGADAVVYSVRKVVMIILLLRAAHASKTYRIQNAKIQKHSTCHTVHKGMVAATNDEAVMTNLGKTCEIADIKKWIKICTYRYAKVCAT